MLTDLEEVRKCLYAIAEAHEEDPMPTHHEVLVSCACEVALNHLETAMDEVPDKGEDKK